MAGSFSHCMSEVGEFRFDLIENMGDAHEACEHMHFMILYIADRTKPNPPGQLGIIMEAEEAYYAERGIATPPHPPEDA